MQLSCTENNSIIEISVKLKLIYLYSSMVVACMRKVAVEGRVSDLVQTSRSLANR
jgi:hypothetical protein